MVYSKTQRKVQHPINVKWNSSPISLPSFSHFTPNPRLHKILLEHIIMCHFERQNTFPHWHLNELMKSLETASGSVISSFLHMFIALTSWRKKKKITRVITEHLNFQCNIPACVRNRCLQLLWDLNLLDSHHPITSIYSISLVCTRVIRCLTYWITFTHPGVRFDYWEEINGGIIFFKWAELSFIQGEGPRQPDRYKFQDWRGW